MSPSLLRSPGVGAHREIRDVRQALVDDVGEGAVALVEVEAIGRLEIVGDVDVGPAVVVDVDPERGVALGQAPDAGLGGDIGEVTVAVVVKQVVRDGPAGLWKNRGCW